MTTVAAAVVGLAGAFTGIGLGAVLGTDDVPAAVVVTNDPGASIDSDAGSGDAGSGDAGSGDAGSGEVGPALLTGSDPATFSEDRAAEDRVAEDRAADLAESADCDLA